MSTALDTIHLSFSSDFIKSMDWDKFSLSETTTKHSLIIRSYSLREKRPGLESLKINEHTETVAIKVNSKILGINYPKGICKDTLEQFIYEINVSGITLNRAFLEEATVSRVDVKNDLVLKNDTKYYTNSLNHLAAPGFAKTPYKTGVSFHQEIITTPVRLCFYDKEVEINRNGKFIKLYPELINTFGGTLRAESRFAGKSTIKKHFGGYCLTDVLASEHINYKVFCKIAGKQEFIKLVDTQDMTLNEERNFGHILYLHQLYNGDFDKIANHIKSKLGKNTKPTYQINKLREYFSLIENSTENLIGESIEEIKNALFEQA